MEGRPGAAWGRPGGRYSGLGPLQRRRPARWSAAAGAAAGRRGGRGEGERGGQEYSGWVGVCTTNWTRQVVGTYSTCTYVHGVAPGGGGTHVTYMVVPVPALVLWPAAGARRVAPAPSCGPKGGRPRLLQPCADDGRTTSDDDGGDDGGDDDNHRHPFPFPFPLPSPSPSPPSPPSPPRPTLLRPPSQHR